MIILNSLQHSYSIHHKKLDLRGKERKKEKRENFDCINYGSVNLWSMWRRICLFTSTFHLIQNQERRRSDVFFPLIPSGGSFNSTTFWNSKFFGIFSFSLSLSHSLSLSLSLSLSTVLNKRSHITSLINFLTKTFKRDFFHLSY